jgi:hypothetical protein
VSDGWHPCANDDKDNVVMVGSQDGDPVGDGPAGAPLDDVPVDDAREDGGLVDELAADGPGDNARGDELAADELAAVAPADDGPADELETSGQEASADHRVP